MITSDTLLESIPDSPGLKSFFLTLLKERDWFMRPLLNALTGDELSDYSNTLQDIWELLIRFRETDIERLAQNLIAGLDYHGIEFLRRQVVFDNTGSYQASSDPESIRRTIYENDKQMDLYLDGLLMSQVIWPNHYRMLDFYKQDYLTAEPAGHCLEIGPGHGYFSVLQMRAPSATTYMGIDISPHSVNYANRMLRAAGINPNRITLTVNDFLEMPVRNLSPAPRIVLAEVLEHVSDPDAFLVKLGECSTPDSVWYITTVINLEAIDHLYLFESVESIHAMFKSNNLSVEKECVLPLKISDSQKRFSANYAAVCRKQNNQDKSA